MIDTKLSVNINKVALIRNSRPGNFPNLVKYAMDCEKFGADGITVHPRPDERHVKFADLSMLKQVVKTELNVEGNPHEKFMNMILMVRPHQCTLVPDAEHALTSDSGWDTISNHSFLEEVTGQMKEAGIRVSIFVDAEEKMVEGAAKLGANRIEFYTGNYAKEFLKNPEKAVEKHVRCAKIAQELGLEINAGHDLNLNNLRYYQKSLPILHEVSIGHALTVDALYYGLENAIQMYKSRLSIF